MRRRGFALFPLVATLAACHLLVGIELRVVGDDPDAAPDASAPEDAAADVTDAEADADDGGCDLGKPFGTPILVPVVNSIKGMSGAALSRDERELFITRFDPQGRQIVHRSTRASRSDLFSEPTPVPELVGAQTPQFSVALSADSLDLYMSATPPHQIFRAHRPTTSAPFEAPVFLPLADAAFGLDHPSLGSTAQLFFTIRTGIQEDIYGAQSDDAGGFVTPRALDTLNTFSTETAPIEAPDGLTFFYAAGSATETNVVVSQRASDELPFLLGSPISLPAAAKIKFPVHVSTDGCRLYVIMENAPGGFGRDLWMISRPR